ncbi:MAG: hypothetical protein MJ211_14655 [Bacteroidales bacterium]|nr:hypothetical protein [Bacteroidales bacterium]
MKNIILILVISFLPFFAFSQNLETDSLMSVNPNQSIEQSTNSENSLEDGVIIMDENVDNEKIERQQARRHRNRLAREEFSRGFWNTCGNFIVDVFVEAVVFIVVDCIVELVVRSCR